MPTYDPISSYGTLVQIGNGQSPEVFTTIFGVGDIDGPNSSVGSVETTSHSTGTAYKTKALTMIDPGDLSFEVQYVPNHPTHTDAAPATNAPMGLGYAFNNRQYFNVRLVAPDPSATTRQFRSFVQNFGESYPVEGIMKRKVTLGFASAPVKV